MFDNKKLDLADLSLEVIHNLRDGKETLCPYCGTRINVFKGMIDGDPIEMDCSCHKCSYHEKFVIKPFANGKRRWHTDLSESEKEEIKSICIRLDIPIDKIKFVNKEHGTAYIPETDTLNISGNVYPDTSYPNCIQDMIGCAEVLAHEWYGHRLRKEDYLNNKICEYHMDEALASRDAARNCKSLTKREKLNLYKHTRYHIEGGNIKEIMTKEEIKWMYGLSNTLESMKALDNI